MGSDSTPGRRFYQRQIALLEAGEVERLVEEQYRPEAVLAGIDFVVSGRAELIEHFRNYLARLGAVRLASTEGFRETSDSILFEATLLTDLGEVSVYNVVLLNEGRASRHFTGIRSPVLRKLQEA